MHQFYFARKPPGLMACKWGYQHKQVLDLKQSALRYLNVVHLKYLLCSEHISSLLRLYQNRDRMHLYQIGAKL